MRLLPTSRRKLLAGALEWLGLVGFGDGLAVDEQPIHRRWTLGVDLTFQLNHAACDLDLATLLKLREIDPFQPAAGLAGVRRLRGKYEPDEQDRPPAAVPRARTQGMATFHYLASYPNQVKSLNQRGKVLGEVWTREQVRSGSRWQRRESGAGDDWIEQAANAVG